MPEFKPAELTDDLFAFPKGMNMGRAPILLPKDQLAYAENATVRGDFPGPRPPYYRRTLLFSATTGLTTNLTAAQVESNFKGGNWQGACFFKSDLGVESLLCMISGHLYKIAVAGATFTVSDITPTIGTSPILQDANETSQMQASMWQAERWAIVENGLDDAIIYDGLTARRSKKQGTVLGTIATLPPTLPEVGTSFDITLVADFAGEIGDMVYLVAPASSGQPLATTPGFGQFRVLTYTSTSDLDNATVTNTDNTNQSIAAGDSVQLGTAGTAYTAFANVASVSVTPVPAGGTATVQFTAAYPGSVGDLIYAQNPDLYPQYNFPPFRVLSGAGTTTVVVRNEFTQAVAIFPQVNMPWYYPKPTTVYQVIGKFALAETIAGNATANIQLEAPYNGANSTAVVINGIHYTISKYTPSAAAHHYRLWCISHANDQVTGAVVPNSSKLLSCQEIPIGKLGCYAQSRNWVCLADGRSYWASDLPGDSSGNPNYNYRDAVLKSATNDLLNGGGVFTVPGSPPDIRAIFATVQTDTSLGQGPVGIGTPYAMFSNNAPLDRSTWQNLSTPLQTVSVVNYGPLGQDSTVAANGDIFYRSYDGIRSYVMARRDMDQWGNLPQSLEIRPVLAADTQSLLQYGSGIVFDTRILQTIAPQQLAQGIIHTKIGVLNFDLLGSLIAKQPSCYDGIWTGLNVLRLLTGIFAGEQRAFAFTLDDGVIGLTEIFSSAQSGPDDGETAITWEIHSPILFRPEGLKDRKYIGLADGEVWVDNMTTACTFEAYYRPDNYPVWVPWLKWTENLNPNVSPGFRPRMGLGTPSITPVDNMNNRPLSDGYYFQVKLRVTGQCNVVGARFKANTKPEPSFAPMASNATSNF